MVSLLLAPTAVPALPRCLRWSSQQRGLGWEVSSQETSSGIIQFLHFLMLTRVGLDYGVIKSLDSQ